MFAVSKILYTFKYVPSYPILKLVIAVWYLCILANTHYLKHFPKLPHPDMELSCDLLLVTLLFDFIENSFILLTVVPFVSSQSSSPIE